ncbi:MAG: GNAT family N-acetyltransferase [Prevotella sp.]|jgi:diamine N-acetyltransferase
MNKPTGTPKICLRAMEPEDLDLLYKVENDQEIWCVGSTNVPYSRYALHNYMAEATGDIYTDKQVRLMIDNESGETVGMVDLVNFNPQHQRAEVGIVIKKPYRGKGYARAAMDDLVNYSRRVLHLHQLYAIVSLDNITSLCLFRDLGFQSDMKLHEWLYDGDSYKDALLMQYFL